MDRIAAGLSNILGMENVKTDEPMKLHTTFKVGGPADIYASPGSVSEIAEAVAFLRAEGVPCFIMGNGSNLVVSDKGIRGVVLNLFDRFGGFDVDTEAGVIKARAGALLSRLAKAALDAGLTGMEFAAGIPGTLGGAVAMNAGAYDGEIRDVLLATEFLAADGTVCEISCEEHRFGYRKSVFQHNGGIILESSLKLRPGDREAIKAKMDDFAARRRSKQPLEYPSAGSVFRRPEGYFTGKLIEDCGLKGHRLGGAQVSEKHAGFIINAGGATACDITGLVEYIKATVYNKFNVRLETEIKFVPPEDC